VIELLLYLFGAARSRAPREKFESDLACPKDNQGILVARRAGKYRPVAAYSAARPGTPADGTRSTASLSRLPDLALPG
jgi:hypothetical protein